MAGAIAYISGESDRLAWKTLLEAGLGTIDFRTLNDGLGNIDEIEVALAWNPKPGLLSMFTNMKMIVSLGMGVDHLLTDDKLPQDVPITRIMDDGLVGQMSEYAIYWALRHHSDIDKYEASQRNKTWKPERFVDTIERRVGVMGFGTIGQDTARKFAALGFPTAGWSRTAKTLSGIETFHGPDGFAQFLARTDILVDVLPLTRDTMGLLDAKAFAGLPRGAYFINMARGGHVVDSDLLAALDSGHLSGAALDVFSTEPLPTDHRFWTHPRVRVTPHIAGATNPRTAAPGVIENIRRLRAGQALINTVDPKTGY
ncbi:2-hydroxyacid dehydrogenase [Bradyrhizobium vignae]|uniref:Glyoxylate/hydroxypyruvate reductase A n=1 Tax=Bradyrhizobium vignae TaxID=1549949 RepID=A0A2U3Q9L5_9BRAD|nr:glyoxylate/hydroxypyruvate reductase A [Bradyrhizobium vignae]SPP98114.1 Glyoxylate/hydroxypyruvate reductase A [Bradyrhizobium vignae]